MSLKMLGMSSWSIFIRDVIKKGKKYLMGDRCKRKSKVGSRGSACFDEKLKDDVVCVRVCVCDMTPTTPVDSYYEMGI